MDGIIKILTDSAGKHATIKYCSKDGARDASIGKIGGIDGGWLHVEDDGFGEHWVLIETVYAVSFGPARRG